MASKRRIRRKSCVGKIQYPNSAEAQAAAVKRSGISHSRILPYKCEFGGHWHIGHTPAKIRRAVRARMGNAY